jgi:hypothetical protein
MNRSKQLLGALIAAVIVNLVGVLFFFEPIADGDTLRLSVHPLVAFTVYVVLSVTLFDWAARQMSSPFKAAFVVAAAQVILIADFTLSGKRGPMTFAAGAVLIIVTWVCVSFVYSRLGAVSKRDENSDSAPRRS